MQGARAEYEVCDASSVCGGKTKDWKDFVHERCKLVRNKEKCHDIVLNKYSPS